MKFLGKKKEAVAQKDPAAKTEAAAEKTAKVKIKPQKKQTKSKKRF